MATAFERLGGEEKLRAIIDDFVERIFGDVMIGYLFHGIEQRRIRELEYQHAAEHLGGPVRYRGRNLRAAHAKHHIRGGQFDRRKQILRETFEAHAVPADIAEAWLAQNESLRGEITAQGAGECTD